MLLNFSYKIPISLKKLNEQIKLSFEVFKENHKLEYKFARAIYGSWYCSIKNCKFCFLSTQKNTKPFISKRRIESIIGEAIIMKEINAELENFTGGILGNDYSELIKITKLLYFIFKEPIWINLNIIPLKIWDEIKKYIKGLIISTETFNERLRKFVAPSKPLTNIKNIFDFLDSEKKQKGCTLIIGLGENWRDVKKTNEFLNTYEINQLNFYGLKPIENTFYENKVSPPLPYFLYWLSSIRIENPKLIISASKSVNYLNEYFSFFRSGANYYSKLKFFDYFNKEGFKKFDYLCKKYNINQKTKVVMDKKEFFEFKEKILNFDLDKLEKKVGFSLNKELILKKLDSYLKTMEKNL